MTKLDEQHWLKYRPATQAIRVGQSRSAEQEHSEPIYATSSFVFDSAEQAAARFSYQEDGNVYSRFTNPTVATFEKRLAALEGGQACVATASGMSAMLSVCLSGLKHGDHIVSSASIFGATRMMIAVTLRDLGISCTFVDLTDLNQWRAALTKQTRMVFFETPTNPLTELGDIAAISELVHAYNRDIKVVVDNCFCTPALQQPLALGADVVLHSATKFIDGQGRCVGGAVVGDEEFVDEKVFGFMRTAGPCMSPFNAWVFLKGLETLSIRVNQACDNAQVLANWLSEQDLVEQVYYPGLESHPQHHLATRQQSKYGAVVTFKVKGGQERAWKLINQTELLSITANLGDTRTTITHPYSTTHARWSDDDKKSVGIDPAMIRIAVGLEDVQDVIEDLNL